MSRLLRFSLWQRVFLGLLAGVIVGAVFGERACSLQPLGTIFINLILMIVVPLIFFVLVDSITSIRNIDNLRRLSIKSIIAFIGTALMAVVLGMLMTHILQPGVASGLQLQASAQVVSAPATQLLAVLGNIVPQNIFKAMAEGNILQVILFAFFLGFVLRRLGSRAVILTDFVHQAAKLMLRMIEYIVRLAPLGVFGYMAAAVGGQGLELLLSLGRLILCILCSCLVQYILFGVIIVLVARLKPWPFYKKILGPQLLAFATGSSKATMPTLIQVMHEDLGVSQNSANFLVPLSAALNMDGGAIYLGSCVVFFAQVTGLELGWHGYLVTLLTCTLGSIGAAGIPSGIILFLGMALTAVGLPIEGVALIAGVDRLLDMVTTLINVTGDACLTLVIEKTEKKLKVETYYAN